MGVTIHYNGKIKSKAKLPELVAEVKDIAISMDWDYTVFSETFPEGDLGHEMHDGKLYGMCFSPPGCERVWLSFTSNGRLAGPFILVFEGEESPFDDDEGLYGAFTKTQFAGVDIHKAIVELFRYLQGKDYFEEFSVIDEGEYWERSDEAFLKSKFDLIDRAIDSLSLAIETVPKIAGEETIDYCERLMTLIHKHLKENPGDKPV